MRVQNAFRGRSSRVLHVVFVFGVAPSATYYGDTDLMHEYYRVLMDRRTDGCLTLYAVADDEDAPNKPRTMERSAQRVGDGSSSRSSVTDTRFASERKVTL